MGCNRLRPGTALAGSVGVGDCSPSSLGDRGGGCCRLSRPPSPSRHVNSLVICMSSQWGGNDRGWGPMANPLAGLRESTGPSCGVCFRALSLPVRRTSSAQIAWLSRTVPCSRKLGPTQLPGATAGCGGPWPTLLKELRAIDWHGCQPIEPFLL